VLLRVAHDLDTRRHPNIVVVADVGAKGIERRRAHEPLSRLTACLAVEPGFVPAIYVEGQCLLVTTRPRAGVGSPNDCVRAHVIEV
jgi:hypothetical protein